MNTKCLQLLPYLIVMAACGGGEDESQLPAAEAGRAPPLPVTASVERSPSALHDQVEALRREVAEIRRELARIESKTVARHDNDPEAQRHPQRAAEVDLQGRGVEFRAEPVDSQWSRDTTARLRDVLAAIPAGTPGQVPSIECRSRSCRVLVGGELVRSVDVQLPALLASLGPTLPHVAVGRLDSGDGREWLEVYLSR